jgi:hypothetical protein
MKKTVLSIVLGLLFLSTQAQQGNVPASQVTDYYETGYVFTGEIENVVDSVFAISVIFSTAGFSKIQSLVVNDSATVTLTGANATNDVEIHNNGNKVSIWIRKYDKYYPPVITHFIGSDGNKTKLYCRVGEGQFQDPSQIIENNRQRREALKK